MSTLTEFEALEAQELETPVVSTESTTADFEALEAKETAEFTDTTGSTDVAEFEALEAEEGVLTPTKLKESTPSGDTGEAIYQGVVEGLAPYKVLDESKLDSGDKVTKAVTNIATSIGSTVLAAGVTGAAVGSAFGPGPGTVAGAAAGVVYGLYQAVATEVGHGKRTGEEFSAGRVALGAALEINPILKFGKHGSKISKLIKATSQAGLGVAQAKSYGASNEMAALLGAVGGGLAGVVHKPSNKEALTGLATLANSKGGQLGADGKPIIPQKQLATSMEFTPEDLELYDLAAKRITNPDNVYAEIGEFVAADPLKINSVEEMLDSVLGMTRKFDAEHQISLNKIIDKRGLSVDALVDDYSTKLKGKQEVASGESAVVSKLPESDEATKLIEPPVTKTKSELTKLKDEAGAGDIAIGTGKPITPVGEELSSYVKAILRGDVKVPTVFGKAGSPNEFADRRQFATMQFLFEDMNKFKNFVVDPSVTQSGRMRKGSDLHDAFTDIVKRNSPDASEAAFLKEAYAKYKMQSATLDLIEAGQHKTLVAYSIDDPLKNKFVGFVYDQLFAGRKIDKAYGVGAEPLFNQVANDYRRHTIMMNGMIKTHKKLNKLSKAAKIKPTEMYEYLTNPVSREALSPLQQSVVKKWQGEWEDLRLLGNKNGINIESLDHYAPERTKSPVELMTAGQNKLREVIESKLGGSGSRWKSLKPVELEELVRLGKADSAGKSLSGSTAQLLGFLEHLSDLPIKDARSLKKAIESISDFTLIKKKFGQEAKAAFSRTGQLPEFIKEKNADKLFLGYSNNLSKAINMHSSIQELGAKAAQLNALGASGSRDYLLNLARDLSGGRSSGLAHLLQSMGSKWKVSMQEVIDHSDFPGATTIAGIGKNAPDVMGILLSQIYPNYLGLTLKAPLRNTLQPILLTAPEISEGLGGYGKKLAVKAMGGHWKDRAAGKGKALKQNLQDNGWLGEQFTGDSHRVMYDSLQDSATLKVGANVLDSWSRFALKAYAGSDAINRDVTRRMSAELVKDALAGNASAIKFFSTLSSQSYKAKLNRMLQGGAPEADITNTVTEYLLAKTQFNYGSQSLGEFGRSLGPLFSMFSKWPAMVGSDIIEHVQDRRYSAVLSKYLAPYAGLGILGSYLLDTKDDPRQRALFGYGGLKDWTPGSTAINIGAISTPPVMQLGADIGKTLGQFVDGDVKEAGRTLSRSLLPYVPIATGLQRGIDQAKEIITNKDQRKRRRK